MNSATDGASLLSDTKLLYHPQRELVVISETSGYELWDINSATDSAPLLICHQAYLAPSRPLILHYHPSALKFMAMEVKTLCSPFGAKPVVLLPKESSKDLNSSRQSQLQNSCTGQFKCNFPCHLPVTVLLHGISMHFLPRLSLSSHRKSSKSLKIMKVVHKRVYV